MENVYTFRPRRRDAAGSRIVLSGPALRERIEDAAQSALDQAETLIGILDRMDGSPDDEDGGDAEPSLGAPEGHASQVVWLRGGDQDLEHHHPETVK